MKQISKDKDMLHYSEAVEAWDKKHRIIGKVPASVLVAQSLDALTTLGPESSGTLSLVDVGAGAGVVGVPWLSLNSRNRAIFVESDAKKTAFLRYYLGSQPQYAGRWLVLSQKLESVSRETIFAFAGDFFCVARAFSGPRPLADCVKDSELCRDIFYIFHPSDTQLNSFMLKILLI